MKLDAFTFSILTKCDNEKVAAGFIKHKLADQYISSFEVLQFMEGLEKKGFLVFSKDRFFVKCSELGKRRVCETRKRRDGK